MREELSIITDREMAAFKEEVVRMRGYHTKLADPTYPTDLTTSLINKTNSGKRTNQISLARNLNS
jgi:hypothetical protein